MRGSKEMNRDRMARELVKLAKELVSEDDPCWEGYEQYGMKDKDGVEVPNCVPKKSSRRKAYGLDRGSLFKVQKAVAHGRNSVQDYADMMYRHSYGDVNRDMLNLLLEAEKLLGDAEHLVARAIRKI